MTDLAFAPADQPWRPIRRTLKLDAWIREQRSCPLAVTLTELSIIDCRIWAGFRLAEARDAALLLPDLAPLHVRVVWSRDWQAELAFAHALHSAVVAHLVKMGTDPIPRDEV